MFTRSSHLIDYSNSTLLITHPRHAWVISYPGDQERRASNSNLFVKFVLHFAVVGSVAVVIVTQNFSRLAAHSTFEEGKKIRKARKPMRRRVWTDLLNSILENIFKLILKQQRSAEKIIKRTSDEFLMTFWLILIKMKVKHFNDLWRYNESIVVWYIKMSTVLSIVL